ncbi:unnamed protein product [Phaedon cochleariae]|uniref:Uncharacterized protein n=1 Tax=Phaedon cochleariae TaxID=80249 RepID=A0A9N9SCR8_PHACE|nr:unnamed protein product [Phaedon cochleariae]
MDGAFFDALENLNPDKEVDINIFNYIIKQKDIIIHELREKIQILSLQIGLINKDEIPSTRESISTNNDKKAVGTKTSSNPNARRYPPPRNTSKNDKSPTDKVANMCGNSSGSVITT